MCVCFVCRSELSALCEETNAICIIDVIVIFVAEHECAHFRSFRYNTTNLSGCYVSIDAV
jgi:hypothetical protein